MASYTKGSFVESDLVAALERAKKEGLVLDYRDNTKSKLLPDYWVLYNHERLDTNGLSKNDVALIVKKIKSGAWLEAKARSYYSMKNWDGFGEMGISAENAFVEDDLTIRRMEYCGDGLAQYLIVGTESGRIFVYPASFLNRITLARLANRKFDDSPDLKGKWMLSLEWGTECKSMDVVVKFAFKAYRQGAEWAGVLESYSSPTEIEGVEYIQGIPRTQEHRQIDLEDKRG